MLNRHPSAYVVQALVDLAPAVAKKALPQMIEYLGSDLDFSRTDPEDSYTFRKAGMALGGLLRLYPTDKRYQRAAEQVLKHRFGDDTDDANEAHAGILLGLEHVPVSALKAHVSKLANARPPDDYGSRSVYFVAPLARRVLHAHGWKMPTRLSNGKTELEWVRATGLHLA